MLAMRPPPDAHEPAGNANPRQQGNPPDAGLSPSNPRIPDAREIIVGHRKATLCDAFPKGRARQYVGHGRDLPHAAKIAGIGEDYRALISKSAHF